MEEDRAEEVIQNVNQTAEREAHRFDEHPHVDKETDILEQISMPGVCLINSKSQGGKSHAAHCIFYANRSKFAWGVAFSNTVFNEDNMTFVPKEFKHRRYNKEVLREVLVLQLSVPQERRPLVFIAFDDCITDFHMEDKVLMEAITQTKHYNIFIMITTQSINKVPNFARENAFQVLLFKMFSKNQLDAAYDSYGQDFETVKDFKKRVNNRLGDHVFAFINRHGAGEWKFCKFPPPPLPRFQFRYGPSDYVEDDKKDGHKKKKKGSNKKKYKKRKTGKKHSKLDEESDYLSSE